MAISRVDDDSLDLHPPPRIWNKTFPFGNGPHSSMEKVHDAKEYGVRDEREYGARDEKDCDSRDETETDQAISQSESDIYISFRPRRICSEDRICDDETREGNELVDRARRICSEDTMHDDETCKRNELVDRPRRIWSEDRMCDYKTCKRNEFVVLVYRLEGGTDYSMATSPGGNGSLFCVRRWLQKRHFQQMYNTAGTAVRCQLKTEKEASEIAALRKKIYQKDEEIKKWRALCKRREKDLEEMEKWIEGFKPVMDENECRIEQQESTILELKGEINRLINLATTLVVLVFSKHWLNLTSSYQLKLP